MDVTFVSVAVLLLLLLLFASYVKTSPNIAMVISGLTKKPRYLVGKVDSVYRSSKRQTNCIWGRLLWTSRPRRLFPQTTSSM